MNITSLNYFKKIHLILVGLNKAGFDLFKKEFSGSVTFCHNYVDGIKAVIEAPSPKILLIEWGIPYQNGTPEVSPALSLLLANEAKDYGLTDVIICLTKENLKRWSPVVKKYNNNNCGVLDQYTVTSVISETATTEVTIMELPTCTRGDQAPMFPEATDWKTLLENYLKYTNN